MNPFECFNNAHYSTLLAAGEVTLLPTLCAYPSKRAPWGWTHPPATPSAPLWERAGRCSLGAVARLDRVVVLDADNVEAAARVSDALQALGVTTMQVRTARGMHFYLRADGAHNQTLAGGIDVKTGRRSYVVAPGSMHPTGHVYTFANDAVAASLSRRDFYSLLHALGALEQQRVPDDVPDVPERVPVGERNTTLFALAQRMSTDALLGAEGAQLRAAAMGWGLTAGEVGDVVGRVLKSRIGYVPSSDITRVLGVRSSVDAVYAALQRIARRTRGKTFRASQRDVAVNARLTRSTVARALKELQALGLLEQVEQGGREAPARWRLLTPTARALTDEGDSARDMDVTGQRALAWTRGRAGEWTARDMAQALGVTERTARRQISRLVGLGFCAPCAPAASQKQGRGGRPAARYVSTVSSEGAARLEQRAQQRRRFLASTYKSDRLRWADELTARALKRAERAARQWRLLAQEHPHLRVVVSAPPGVMECTPSSVGVERLLGGDALVTLPDWGVAWHVRGGALAHLELLTPPAQLTLLR